MTPYPKPLPNPTSALPRSAYAEALANAAATLALTKRLGMAATARSRDVRPPPNKGGWHHAPSSSRARPATPALPAPPDAPTVPLESNQGGEP